MRTRINWPQFDSILGKVPDAELARKIGCSNTSVARRRKELGIKPLLERTTWSEEDNRLFTEEGCIKCRKCNRVLSSTAFTKNKKATLGYRKECSECHQKVIKARRRKIKTFWVDKMGGCCQNCGFKKWLGPLQFHHIEWGWQNRIEENTYPNIVLYRRYDAAKIREELDKCCLLCSVCHDAVHSDELHVKFVKRPTIGWTVESSECWLTLQNCPTEDKGIHTMSLQV